jgi:PAS domain S-box-containing protein
MPDRARYALVPIDSVRPIEAAEGRWCGHATLPGDRELHTLIIEARDGDYVGYRADCNFDGWRNFSCPRNESMARVCSADCESTATEQRYAVVRISGEFFLALDGAMGEVSGQRRALLDELAALRQANRALEEQVLTVSAGMDRIIAELSEQSRQLQDHNRTQLRLTEFVRRVMDTMDSLLIVLDRFGRIAQINAAAVRLFGRDESSLAGESADVLLSPGDRIELKRNNPNAPAGLLLFQAGLSRSGLTMELELGGFRAPGVSMARVFLLRGSPIHDVAGKLEGVVLVAADVTRLRARERALVESEQRFRDFAAMSTSLVWQTDAALNFVPVDAQDQDFELNFKGKRPIDLALPGERDSTEWQRCLKRLAGRQPITDFETRVRANDGIRWYSISGMPMFNNGEFAGYRGVVVDLTERHEMEEELRKHRDHLSELVHEQTADLIEAKEAAEHANRMKSEFLSNISHELRTPLHSIMSFSRLGLKKVGVADAAEKITGYFDRILVSGGRLTSLVDDLLNLAKLESGDVSLNLSVVDIGVVVGEAAATLEALLLSRGQTLKIDNRLHESTVRIDPNRFNQVLLNLLGNASKFAPHDSIIELTVANGVMPSGEPAFRVSVADSGPGIPEAELEDVFGKFVQSSRTKTGAGGTGLGLAICRQIVMAHGGRISAANRSAGGAVFDVLIPMETVFRPTPA